MKKVLDRTNGLAKLLVQWFLNLLEVPNPASFLRAFTKPLVEIQNISVNKLEFKVQVPKVFERRAGLVFLALERHTILTKCLDDF